MGWVVVLLERIWAGKIAADHPELAGYQEEVLATVSGRITSSPIRGLIAGAYRRRVGPSRWLLVVLSYEQEPGRIVTGLATRKDPKR